MESAPILFLIFNRPDLTKKVFERIRAARPAELFIAADGPRASRAGEGELCRITRGIVEAIDWDCRVNRLYREENLGCKNAVSSAISWFFEHVDRGIILEDDCLPDTSFFPYATEILDRYAGDDRVMAVNGFGSQSTGNDEPSYYFSKYLHVWGWATWRRAWKSYDVTIGEWPASAGKIRENFPREGPFQYFSKCFDEVRAGTLDTWDYQFCHAIFWRKGLCVMPGTNLIDNIGFDSRATHTVSGSSPTEEIETSAIAFPLRHPESLAADDARDSVSEQRYFRVGGGNVFSHACSLCMRFVRIIFLRSNS